MASVAFLTVLFSIALYFVSYGVSQVIYACDFDDAVFVDHCFTTNIIITSGILRPDKTPPYMPISDVTSITKPTNDGKLCAVPYKVGNFTWDMYFCNQGYCPTTMSSNSTCKRGKFGSIPLTDFILKSFQLKPRTDFINGINEQCLIYYYYLSNTTQNSLIVLKQEFNGVNETIDNVTSTPYNGWVKRMVSFFAEKTNYTIFFTVQKISGAFASHASLDEISIHQGYCKEEIGTTSATILTTFGDVTSTSSQSTVQSTIETTVLSTSTTNTVEDTTTMTTTLFTTFSTMAETSTISTSTTYSTTTSTTTTSTTTTSTKTTSSLVTTISTYITTVDTTSTKTNSSDITQTIFTTQYQNATVSPTTTTLTPIGTSSTTLTTTTYTLDNPTNPTDKTLIIVLATVIPTLVILAAVGMFLWKRSALQKSASNSYDQVLDSRKKNQKRADLELDSLREHGDL